MKRLLSLFVLLAIMVTMVSCSTEKFKNLIGCEEKHLVNEIGCEEKHLMNEIDYGKKYLQDKNCYYVFKEDQTGYYECYYKYTSDLSPQYSYTLSGRVEFVWRETFNGAVYLFETKSSYNEDHTEGERISIITAPIYFSEDFFTYSYSTQYGSGTVCYIKEGSELEKSLEK